MRRDVMVVLAVLAIVSGFRSGTAAAADSGEAYYCPPGAKFCPAPGTAPSPNVALDTQFGVNPQAAPAPTYAAPAPVQTAYAAPPVSVENRYVPYAGAQPSPQQVYVAQAQPPQYQPVYPTPPTQKRTAAAPARDAASEVANQQTARIDSKREKTKGDKIPWWKGGMWRNRGSDDGGGKKKAKSGGGSSADFDEEDDGPGALSASDDMWDNEDYTGYNPDGSYGGRGSVPPQQASGGGYDDPFGQPQFNTNPYADTTQTQYASDPYAAPTTASQPPVYASEPYSQPYATDPYSQPQYASDPYASPPPLVTGTVGDVYTLPSDSYSTGNTVTSYPTGNVTYGTPAPTPSYQSAPQAYSGQEYVPPLNFDPGQTYTAQPQSYVATSDSAFLPPPSGSQPLQSAPPSSYKSAAAPVSGSPEFQRAVTMVKENRFTEAKSILTGETQQNPSNAAAWRWLADCYYNLLELDSAISAYDRARSLDPNDYYATRGQGFAYLHRGHELWRQMQSEVASGQKERAAETFSQAHENYKKSLELLGTCLRRAPNDGEAIYGEAMAAEGASRKLYSNAISYLKLGPENRERAEIFAENCLTVINKGIERARDRAKQNPGESGPRALLGGLYLRKAILYRQLGKNDLALMELKNAHDTQQSILDEIDKNNASAQKGVAECENYWRSWGGPPSKNA